MQNLIIIAAIILVISLRRATEKNKQNNATGEPLNLGSMEYIKLDKSPYNYDINDAKQALYYARDKYGIEFAKLMERIWRLESANFNSGQFKGTGTGGMEYGSWGKWLSQFLQNPVKLKTYVDPKRGPKYFIIFDDLNNYMDMKHYYINTIRDGNWAAWNSLNADKQTKYRAAVNSIQNTIV